MSAGGEEAAEAARVRVRARVHQTHCANHVCTLVSVDLTLDR